MRRETIAVGAVLTLVSGSSFASQPARRQGRDRPALEAAFLPEIVSELETRGSQPSRPPAAPAAARQAVEASLPPSPTPAAPEGDLGRDSLWDGLVAPLDLPADRAATEPPGQVPEAGGQGASEPALPSDSFVALDLDLKNGAGDLKDAVADLARTAGFRPDARFRPVASGLSPGKFSIWGWLPAARVSDAVSRPGVSRIEIAGNPRSPEAELRGPVSEILAGIRIPAGATPGEVFARVVLRLSREADFRWKRNVGFQRIPGSPDLALIVAGDAPVRSLPRLLGDPEVLKILPGPLSRPASADVPAPPRPRPSLAAFIKFVLARFPLLLALTMLAALLPVKGLASRLLDVFIPYR